MPRRQFLKLKIQNIKQTDHETDPKIPTKFLGDYPNANPFEVRRMAVKTGRIHGRQ